MLTFAFLDIGIQTKGFYQSKKHIKILRIYGTEILLNHALFLMNAWLGETENNQRKTIGLNVQRLYIALALNPTGQALNLYFNPKASDERQPPISHTSNENKQKPNNRQTIAACTATLLGSGPLIVDSLPWKQNQQHCAYRIALNTGYFFASAIAAKNSIHQ